MTFVSEYQSNLPDDIEIPEPILSFMNWLESQGLVFNYLSGDGSFLTAQSVSDIGELTSHIYFVTDPSFAAAWFGSNEASEHIAPILHADGTGGVFAVWQPNSSTPHFVYLGSEGEQLYLTDDPVKFLQLITLGYQEFFEDAYKYSPAEYGAMQMWNSPTGFEQSQNWISRTFNVVYPKNGRDLVDSSMQDAFEKWVSQMIK